MKSDWDDEPTSTQRTWPDLLELQPLEPDDPLLPLVSDSTREDEILESMHVYKVGSGS